MDKIFDESKEFKECQEKIAGIEKQRKMHDAEIKKLKEEKRNLRIRQILMFFEECSTYTNTLNTILRTTLSLIIIFFAMRYISRVLNK